MHLSAALRTVGLIASLWTAPAAVSAAAPAPPAPQATPTPAAPQGPFDLEVAARRTRFAREAARPRSPAAIVPLLGLGPLWEAVHDREALVAFVEEAMRRPGLLPEVRAEALRLRRELAWHRGEGALAARLTAELGQVTSFQLLGPFDNEGGKGHDAVYPPEVEARTPDADAAYEGKSRAAPPRWREVPAALTRDGRLLCDAVLRPDDWATAYAVAYVKNPGPALPVAVRVGASGALKMWVNRGNPVVQSPAYRPLHADQEAGAATLLPGWNRVLVKLSGNEGPWAFTLRLTTFDGAAVPGLEVRAAPPSPGWPVPAARPATLPPGVLRGLRATAAQTRGAPHVQALIDLALYLHHVAPTDPERREDEEAMDQALPVDLSREPALWLARDRARAVVARDVNDRRVALEESRARPVPTQPALVQARAVLLHELGRAYEEGRREPLSEAAHAEALRLWPAFYPAALALSQVQAGRGMPAEALRLLLQAAPLTDTAPLRLQRGVAQLLERAGRRDEAMAVYARVLSLSQDDTEAQRQMLERDKARGDLAAALRDLAAIASTRPEQAQGWIARERAELLEGAGRFAESLQAVDTALASIPAEPELHQLRGRLLLRLSRDAEAGQAYHRALELRPQNPELRTYLTHLDPQARSGDDLWRTFREPVEPLLAGGAKAPVARAVDPARVLLDQTVVRVHDNGLSESFTQRVLQIEDERGAREYADLEIRYSPETQSVEVKAARVHKKDGEVQEIAATGERDVSEPWYGLYYDVRAQTVRFDGLRKGDVIDVEYVISDVGRRNLLADYFGDLHALQEEIPRQISRYVVLMPDGPGHARPLYANVPRGGPGWSVTRTESVETRAGARQRAYRFQATGVPRVDAEPGMPGFTDVAAFVHVSTYRSWEDVATWYTQLIAEQLVPSAELTRAAQQAVAGIADPRARVRAIYDLVVRRTRYVGLEFGIHGYKPYKVAQVFARKFGDCKDKAALLKVMLKAVGIDSTMVLARTRRNGDLPAEPASLAAFDHAIVYVPAFDLFLDGTAEFNGADELPAEDQDIPVLIVADPRPPWNGRGHLARTPVLPAAQSTVTRQVLVRLRPDGGAHVSEKMTVSGQPAPRWREHYQSAGAQRERYEKSWNDSFPGAKVAGVELPHIADLEQPVTLAGEVEVPTWGKPTGGRGDLVLRPLGRDADLLRSYARLSQRKHDLVLGFTWRNVERVTLRLPPGLSVRRAPEPRRIESPFGWFALTVSRPAPGAATPEVVVAAELQVDRHRIGRADYAAFRRFCAEVDQVVEQELVVGHE